MPPASLARAKWALADQRGNTALAGTGRWLAWRIGRAANPSTQVEKGALSLRLLDNRIVELRRFRVALHFGRTNQRGATARD